MLLTSSTRSPFIKLLEERKEELVSAVSLPDRARERAGSRLIPHHNCPDALILSKLLKVRAALLKERFYPGWLEDLGYALHYLQDRCIPKGPLHDPLERRLKERLRLLLDVCSPGLVEVKGYVQLSRAIRDVKPQSEECEVVKQALAATLAALYAVFANPLEPYPEIVDKARHLQELLQGWRGTFYSMMCAAGFWLSTSSMLQVLQTPLLALFFALLAFLFLLALLAAFARKPSHSLRLLSLVVGEGEAAVLRNLPRGSLPPNPSLLNPITGWVLVLTLLSLLYVTLLPIRALPLLFLLAFAVLAPNQWDAFTELRDELAWFRWDERLRHQGGQGRDPPVPSGISCGRSRSSPPPPAPPPPGCCAARSPS